MNSGNALLLASLLLFASVLALAALSRGREGCHQLKDVRVARPRTEPPYINGSQAQYYSQLGVPIVIVRVKPPTNPH